MATYTVKAGDTLSGIAGRLGVPMSQIKGYRSGNANLIYPGEVLSYGAAAPAPAPAAPASAGGGSSDLQKFAESMAAQQNALLERQKAEQEGLFGQYETLRGGQETLTDMYGRVRNDLGIPGLSESFQSVQGEIYNVKNILDRLDENVTSRALGTNMTEAQRQRLVAAEGGELRNQLGRLGTGLEPIAQALSAAQGEMSTLLQLGIQDQDRALEPVKMRINALSDRFAREMTGFSENKQTQLDALVDKIERERFLSDREWELAQQLAAEEREFARQKQLASMRGGSGGGGGVGQYLAPRGGNQVSSSGLNLQSFMPQLQVGSSSPFGQLGLPANATLSGGLKVSNAPQYSGTLRVGNAPQYTGTLRVQ